MTKKRRINSAEKLAIDLIKNMMQQRHNTLFEKCVHKSKEWSYYMVVASGQTVKVPAFIARCVIDNNLHLQRQTVVIETDNNTVIEHITQFVWSNTPIGDPLHGPNELPEPSQPKKISMEWSDIHKDGNTYVALISNKLITAPNTSPNEQ